MTPFEAKERDLLATCEGEYAEEAAAVRTLLSERRKARKEAAEAREGARFETSCRERRNALYFRIREASALATVANRNWDILSSLGVLRDLKRDIATCRLNIGKAVRKELGLHGRKA